MGSGVYAFITLTVSRGEWLASRFGHWNPDRTVQTAISTMRLLFTVEQVNK